MFIKDAENKYKLKRVILKPFNEFSFELQEDYSFDFGFLAKHTIKKGFKTNGADIPRMFWCFFPPNKPEYLSAVLIHDYLCDEAKNTVSLEHKKRAYEKADKVFYYAMQSLDTQKSTRLIFYYACRIYRIIKLFKEGLCKK